MSLDVRDVVVVLDGRTILDRTSLHVATGTLVSVMGANGSGKSTLLRAIAGLVAVRSGSIAVDGHDITDVPTHRRGIGMVFQDLALFGHLDVAANIAYGLRMQGVGRRTRERRVHELLDLVGLAGFGARRVDDLSGGERQRVAVARALAPRPRVLLLDEPFAAVDQEMKAALTAEIGALLRELRVTAVHVTHDDEEPALLGATATIRLTKVVAQRSIDRPLTS